MMRVFPDAAAAAAACASQLAGWMAACIAARGAAHVALSGGSTPRQMLSVLAGLGVDWSRSHLWQVDERGVAPEDAQSNYRMIRESLIDPARVPAAHVHRMMGELDARQAAARYEAELRGALQGRPLDIVQCGMGADGHTASLFPGDARVLDRDGLAAGIWVEEKRQWRITLLPGPILAAPHLCVLAAGADKAAALARALHGPSDVLGTPAQLLRSAQWFVDSAAAAASGDRLN